MRHQPDISAEELIASLGTHYDLNIIFVRFLPVGYDLNAFVYQAITNENVSYFVKLRVGVDPPPGLLVPRFLIEQGIPNILAPLRTRTGALWFALDTYSVVVTPFVRGENAMIVGLSETQWRAFGATLRAIHTGGFASRLHGDVPIETFSIPSAQLVRRVSERLQDVNFASPTAMELAAFWISKASLIEHLLARAEALGKELQSRPFELVLCHADIHAANIMVSEDGGIYLVDWDGPLLAPRERDLLFIVGSMIARRVEPQEEAWFFQGYGAVDVDKPALAYYRYERAIEDIGEAGKVVFLESDHSEEVKRGEADLLRGLFQPGDIVEAALEADRDRF